MFDTIFAGVDADALLAEIEQADREEAKVGARKMAAIAELVRTTVGDDDERRRWAFDPWDYTAAKVGAALRVGHRRASGQMRIAVALRDRLPRVAALYYRGELSSRLISEISWRTHLIEDDALLALIDAALAEGAVEWGPLSGHKLTTEIDSVIERYDPDALRRSKELMRSRDFQVGAHDDSAETATVWGRLLATDAAVLWRRICAMAAEVCDADPRTVGQRRSDALGALGSLNEHLACQCGSQNCPSAGQPSKSNIVIRVIADQAAVDAARKSLEAEQANVDATDQSAGQAAADIADVESEQNDRHVEDADADADADVDAPEPADSQPVSPTSRKDAGAALLMGRGVMPSALLAEAIRGGAKVKPLWLPGADPEPRYRPSAELAEFVRMRDLFCRFPDCDVPADRCDIDHTIPWPLGPTHASNLACKCRTHHLMKTFWVGPDGWTDVQLPDGTLIWTSSSGQSRTTKPGCRLYFPTWNATTSDLPPPSTRPPPHPARAEMMPKRRRTRAADDAARIKAERAQNQASASDCPF